MGMEVMFMEFGKAIKVMCTDIGLCDQKFQNRTIDR